MRRVSDACVLFARMDGWLQEEVRTQEVRTNGIKKNTEDAWVCVRAFNTGTGLLSHYTFRECLYSLFHIGVGISKL